jgi:exopolysaccharide production protein ExoZ
MKRDRHARAHSGAMRFTYLDALLGHAVAESFDGRRYQTGILIRFGACLPSDNHPQTLRKTRMNGKSAGSEHIAPYHLANLDVLRALAVIAVVLHHTKVATGFAFPFLGDFGGLLGVQLFFLISGYLITESAIKHSLHAYVLHRFFRIFPAYWLVYIGLALLHGSGFFFADKTGLISILLNLLNLQQISPKALLQYDVLHVSWTLTVEIFWYMLAPFLVLAGRRWALLSLAVGVLVSTVWSCLAAQGVLDPLFQADFASLSTPVDAGQKSIIVNNAFPAQIVFFIMGSCLYYYRDKLLRLNSTLLNAMSVSFVLLAGIFVNRLPAPIFLTGIGLAAFFLLVLRAPASGDWLLIRIGKVSYSIYLIHFLLILTVARKFGPHIGLYVIPLAFLLIFIVANLLYMFVEKPFILLGRRLSARFATPSTPAPI